MQQTRSFPRDLPGHDAFKRLFHDAPDREKLFSLTEKLLETAYELQELLGPAGGVHVLADKPSSYHEGLLVGSAACVLFSPTIELEITKKGRNPGVLSVLSQIRERRDRLEEFNRHNEYHIPSVQVHKSRDGGGEIAPTSNFTHRKDASRASDERQRWQPVRYHSDTQEDEEEEEQQQQQQQQQQKQRRTTTAERETAVALLQTNADSPAILKPADSSYPIETGVTNVDEDEEMQELPHQREETPLSSARNTDQQRNSCATFEGEILLEHRRELPSMPLYIQDEHLAQLRGIDEVRLRKLYRDTLIALLTEKMKIKAKKGDAPKFPFSLSMLTPPWAGKFIRSSNYEFKVYDHATLNHHFEHIDKIRLLLAAFIQNEPLAAPIVSKLKQSMSMLPDAIPVSPLSPNRNMDKSPDTDSGVPRKTVEKEVAIHADGSPPRKHDQPEIQQQSPGGGSALTPTRKSLRIQQMIIKKTIKNDNNSTTENDNIAGYTETDKGEKSSEQIVFGCANGEHCFMATDKDAQDPEFITGSCSNCKRKVHDRCGGRKEGDEPLVCLACSKNKQT